MHPRCQDARTSTFNRAVDPGGARTLSTAHISAATSFWLEGHTKAPRGAASGEQVPVLKCIYNAEAPAGIVTGRQSHLLSSPGAAPPWKGRNVRATPSWCLGHCLAFFTMVPTAEITVVLEPLALVVTVTTAGRVAVVVRMVGWAMVVTGMAESHLLFLF